MKSDPLLKAVAWVPLEVKPFVFFPLFGQIRVEKYRNACLSTQSAETLEIIWCPLSAVLVSVTCSYNYMGLQLRTCVFH